MSYFFKRDLSMAHAVSAGCVTFSIYRGHYIAAGVLFVLAVVICTVVEHALERR